MENALPYALIFVVLSGLNRLQCNTLPCFSFLQAAHMQDALEESVQMMKEAVDDLGATLAEAASAAGAVGGMVDSINDAINKMEDTPTQEPEGTFVDYQTTMVKTAKAIAVTVQEMVRNE